MSGQLRVFTPLDRLCRSATLAASSKTLGPEFHEERKPVAKTTTKRKETFELVEPLAGNVQLVGDFTGWQRRPIELERQKDGVWRATVPLEPGAHEYRFLVDGQWRDDCRCEARRANPFGGENCVREVSP
jgi:1,4-alpha-glucan branching enzyme